MRPILRPLLLTLIVGLALLRCGGVTPPRSAAPLQEPGPLRILEQNRRYFSSGDGRAVYLVGSHFWSNLQDQDGSDPPPRFDSDRYLDWLQRQQFNFQRLWYLENASFSSEAEQYWVEPLPYPRTGPGVALDGKPKFDLDRWNEQFFARMSERLAAAERRGIYSAVMLFNGWTVGTKHEPKFNPWKGHPFNAANNINGVDGDLDRDGEGKETHRLTSGAIFERQKRWVHKVIDTVNRFDHVLYEISNESDPGSRDWQYALINEIHDYESRLPKQHPVGMSVEFPDGDSGTLLDSPADWIAPNGWLPGHQPGRFARWLGPLTNWRFYPRRAWIDDPPDLGGKKVVVLDTDHLWGLGGEARWVYEAFLRGNNVLFMDPYERVGYSRQDNPDDPKWVALRAAMSGTARLAARVELAMLTPQPKRCSSRYCLAGGRGNSSQLLALSIDGAPLEVDLSLSAEPFELEWYDTARSTFIKGGPIPGGGVRSLQPPCANDVVAVLTTR